MVVSDGIERTVAAIDEPAVEIIDVRPVPTLRIVALELVIKDVEDGGDALNFFRLVSDISDTRDD